MAALSWKSLSLFGAILVIALGLQAGAIKLMVGLPHEADQPARSDAHSTLAPAPGTEAPPVKPAEVIADPPPLTSPSAESASNPEAQPLSPEAHSAPAPASIEAQPSIEARGGGAKPLPSPETQTLPAPPHNPMISNIPPPIELEPEPAPPQPASAEANLAAVTPPATPTAAPGALLEPDWLKGRDPKRYTVQLYSGKDMAKLREIAGSVAGAAPSAYFVTASRSGPWYSLVVGDYADFTAAQTVAAQIAAQSSTLKPWIRRFSEIQARMR